jgi:hypothetical protein
VHARRLSHLLFWGNALASSAEPLFLHNIKVKKSTIFLLYGARWGKWKNYCCKTGNGPSLLIHKLQHTFLCASELLLLLLATFSFSMKQ